MQRIVETLREETFDLLILGGGITGAGVALDAALRGLRVALIDKGDFASGTSSVSSKLVHGGLRYLEQGSFRLVYEALQERRTLLDIAPHLVQPLRFVLPFYRGARLRPWQWRLALTIYDLLAGTRNIHRSRPLDRCYLQKTFPDLQTRGLSGGAEYYDAQMDDARLCVEIIHTAAQQGARVANYVEAVAFEHRDGRITGVHARDHVRGQEFVIRARQILNATGPWIDAVCRLAGEYGQPRLQPTKGVHLVTADRGVAAAFLLLHPRDGRVGFVIPWLGKTLIGTTDTWCGVSPDQLQVLPEEIDYLLEAYNHYFRSRLQPGDVLNSFAGLRPLIRSQPGSPSSLSREFRLFTSPTGLLSVAGGKYTTYRRMAEIITDKIVQRLGCRRRSRTSCFRLAGAPPQPWATAAPLLVAQLCRAYQQNEATAWHLVQRYGARALQVAQYALHQPERNQPIIAGEPDLLAEWAYQRDHEMAIYPEDYLLRRTRLGLFRPELLQCTWAEWEPAMPGHASAW